MARYRSIIPANRWPTTWGWERRHDIELDRRVRTLGTANNQRCRVRGPFFLCTAARVGRQCKGRMGREPDIADCLPYPTSERGDPVQYHVGAPSPRSWASDWPG